MRYEMIGTVKVVCPMQSFSSGFTKQELVITDGDERYPQDIAIAFTKERMRFLENLREGEKVKVSFSIRGREYNGKYYVNLDGFALERLETSAPAADDDLPPDEPIIIEGGLSADDDMPF